MKDRKNIKKVFINLIFIIGFLICLYPLISSIISGYYQKSAIATYNKSINNIEVSALNEDISKAENYNSTLYNYNKISKDRTDIAILKEYENIKMTTSTLMFNGRPASENDKIELEKILKDFFVKALLKKRADEENDRQKKKRKIKKM